MGGTFNTAVVSALARRDLRMYFSNPSGYVFITLFIFLSAAAAFWQDRFFLQNLANLDQLNSVFPYLLLFFIPALTMGVWSEEKKLGTDELLLTLPGADLEVVLGKYLAVLGIYSASLALSLSYVAVLFYLGTPDLGLMASNYAGYWFVGAALIAVGMLASLLTRNSTVAFIAAGLLCAVLVAAGPAAAAVAPGLGRAVEALGVFLHFDDFAKGVVSLSALVYFVSVGSFFLYLNVLVLSRRHWPRTVDGYPMGLHQAVRGVAVAAALVAAGVLVTNRGVRVDVTAEQLHSLSGETRRLLDELPADRPVFIQAFVSPNVPEPFVQTRSNLISILEEIDVIAGPRVEVLVQDTEPFTDAAREARETFGIQPRPIRNVSTARSEVEDVFLGVAFTCGAEEQVIGFFDVGLPAEYEIVRSIRVVAGAGRKRVGVVATMANLFGGTNFQRNQFTPQWSVVSELRKQYDVVEISPEMAIEQDVDALLVPLPSSLQTDEQGFVADYVRSGTPALILVDPLPAVNPTLSPAEWVGDGNPFTYPPGQPRPGPRGNVREWIRGLGVDWEPTRIVWDAYNPHPELAHMPEDVVFLGAGNENPATFDADDPMTARLQELVLLFPGSLEAVDDPRFDFQPLLRSGRVSGANGYFSLVRGTPFGPQVNPSPPRRQDDGDYVVAARVRSVGGPAAGGAPDESGAAGETPGAAEAPAGAEPGETAAEAPESAAADPSAGAGESPAGAESGETAAEAPESVAESAPREQPAGPAGESEDAGAAAADPREQPGESEEGDGAEIEESVAGETAPVEAAAGEEAEAAAGESGPPTAAAESASEAGSGEPDASSEAAPEEMSRTAAESASEAGSESEASDAAAAEEPETAESEAAGAASSETSAAARAAEAVETAAPPAETAPPAGGEEPRPEAVESGEPAAATGQARSSGPASGATEAPAERQEPDAGEPEAESVADPAAESAAADPGDGAAETDPAGTESAEDTAEAVAAEPRTESAEETVETAAADAPAPAESESAAAGPAPDPAGDVDVIVVADLDFISEQFFQIREQAPGGLNFDNVTFFLNAMDTLLGEDAFIDLRGRRARHRTLERVEAQTAQFIEQRTADEQQAEADAEQALTEAQRRLNDRVAELRGRADVDAQTRQIMVRNLEEVENRRLEVLSANIEAEKDTRIQASRENMEAQIRRIQTSIKTAAILLPPVPVVVLGVAIFLRRNRREREGAAAAHRLRE